MLTHLLTLTFFSPSLPSSGHKAVPVPDLAEDDVVVIERKARRGIKNAAMLLSAGLIFEVGATLLTLLQATSLGVFREPDCGRLRVAAYLNDRLPRECRRRYNLDYRKYIFSVWEHFMVAPLPESNYTEPTYAPCASLEDPPKSTGMQWCDCWSDNLLDMGDKCEWVAAKSSAEDLGGLCLAKPLRIKGEYKVPDTMSPFYDGRCKAMHPPGSGKASVGLLVVGLGVELVEAVVGYVYSNNPLAGTSFRAAGSGFEAAGVLMFHLWLARSSVYWYDTRTALDETQAPVRVYFLMKIVVAAIVSTCAGVLANAEFYSSSFASDRLPYLGAFGSALIWLGVALTEVTVTLYLRWRLQGHLSTNYSSTDKDTWGDFGGAIVGLIALEALGLAAVLAARVAFTNAKRMLLRLKVLKEEPPVQAGQLAAELEPSQQPRSRKLVLFLLTMLFCVFAFGGWPSVMESYQYTSKETQTPMFEFRTAPE